MLGVWDDRNDDTVIPRRKMREFTTELALSLEQYEQKNGKWNKRAWSWNDLSDESMWHSNQCAQR